jgi:hypothetical protein
MCDYDYQRTSIDANHYYEHLLMKPKKSIEFKVRKNQYGYSSHGGEISQRNVMMYHHYDISKS